MTTKGNNLVESLISLENISTLHLLHLNITITLNTIFISFANEEPKIPEEIICLKLKLLVNGEAYN